MTRIADPRTRRVSKTAAGTCSVRSPGWFLWTEQGPADSLQPKGVVMELCSWCQGRLATHYTRWNQRPDGRGQSYLYVFCDKCWSLVFGNDELKIIGKRGRLARYEISRDEWLLAKTMDE